MEKSSAKHFFLQLVVAKNSRGSWNSEVFASIMGLSGTVLGIFVGHKA